MRPPLCPTLMVQGTTSDAGKSTLVAGLCRVLARRGVKVAPFKPQNMALNSAVTIDGGEIGRAQAVQAQACRIPPHSDFNPILLKPTSDSGAQVIVHGKALIDLDAKRYHAYKPKAMAAVMESYKRLQSTYDTIVVEGAGSPAEINLREGDIANMGFAETADCPVLLIADIDKGGVFAHIVGTLELLSASEQARIIGFVINRFRGDIALLQPGLDWLEARTGKPVFGVLPYLHGLYLEAEDAISTEQPASTETAQLKVIAPVLPRISNHTDFDVLRLHPQVDFSFIAPNETPPPADLVILPGSKNVRHDLAWLRAQGWETYLQKHLRYGGKVIGICGGMQMLGRTVADPLGLEGDAGSDAGFGLLDFTTELQPHKRLARVAGTLCVGDVAVKVEGYEIHMGVSTGEGLKHPAIRELQAEGESASATTDGAISADGNILGAYVHGVFDHSEACAALLKWAGLEKPRHHDHRALVEINIERLADEIEKNLDLEKLKYWLPL